MQRQNQPIEEHTAAMIRQREEPNAQHAAAMTTPVAPADDLKLDQARRTAFGVVKAHEESRRKLGEE
ncbi:hypothetical protein [Arthrobacter sp. ok362]|uniref:hypothetical protein n=1 Tax=Arthrobacter sp. ok362 TaxID=1761745 RepID=UPI0011136435|nr:hypothetical protein [Arthrobacter sp. ok362]